MTSARGFRILPYRLKRIIQEYYPELVANEDYLARIRDQILRDYLPTLTTPLYDELLRIKLGILAHGPSDELYRAAEDLAIDTYTLDSNLAKINREAAQLADRLDRHLHPTGPDESPQRIEAEARHYWPPPWMKFLHESGWLKNRKVKPDSIIREYLLPHYVPELLEARTPEYLELLNLRADMYLRGRMAYRVLRSAKDLATQLDEQLDDSTTTAQSRQRLKIIRDKVQDFIDEIRFHLRGPKPGTAER